MQSESGEAANTAASPLSLFEILARENADALTVYLRAAVEDQTAVEDLFQDTMLVAWRKIGDYDRALPFGAWLRGIARRLVLSHYRAASRQLTLSNEVLETIDRRVTHLERRPGDTLDEKIAALLECLERLDPIYREPVELHYKHSHSAEAIADRLQATTSAIQKRLQRARQQLANCLAGKGVFPQPD